ncbi:hypothetical protein [Pedobacter sp. BMA]|uniref:hypothetical protein n=1 Tax=Pedobacter sp. BMA TaxID=1663685 RepID=UPI00064A7401|nr:hypothetical protein [Pedobacter sp. BMA]KLT64034.1 hypothetical protein AB669_18390 [Pedobacter sp. BMA]
MKNGLTPPDSWQNLTSVAEPFTVCGKTALYLQNSFQGSGITKFRIFQFNLQTRNNSLTTSNIVAIGMAISASREASFLRNDIDFFVAEPTFFGNLF